MGNNEYDSLKLVNQLCFPLYACAKEIVKKYKPFLEKMNTYVYAIYCNDGHVGT